MYGGVGETYLKLGFEASEKGARDDAPNATPVDTQRREEPPPLRRRRSRDGFRHRSAQQGRAVAQGTIRCRGRRNEGSLIQTGIEYRAVTFKKKKETAAEGELLLKNRQLVLGN